MRARFDKRPHRYTARIDSYVLLAPGFDKRVFIADIEAVPAQIDHRVAIAVAKFDAVECAAVKAALIVHHVVGQH